MTCLDGFKRFLKSPIVLVCAFLLYFGVFIGLSFLVAETTDYLGDKKSSGLVIFIGVSAGFVPFVLFLLFICLKDILFECPREEYFSCV